MSDAGTDLHGVGLRVTAPRVAVLDVLRAGRSAGEHLPASAVAVRARERLGSLSVQAVYDVLDALVGAGLARRIRPSGASSAVYEARAGDNHHHVVCRGCGLTADVDCSTGTAPCVVPDPSALPAGFVLDEAELTFWGRCASCAADPDPSPTAQEDR